MLQNIKKQRQEGFTIIEVMIVLVIAAVILLIVFLAVPALQRNSRNTQMKNESAAVTSAVAEYVSNQNAGTELKAADNGTGDGTGTTAADKIYKLSNAKNLKKVTIQAVPASAITFTATGASPNSTTVYVHYSAKCSTASPLVPGLPEAASARQIAVIYPVEASGGTLNAACIDSGV
jgi:prepilin-type N-terminal cleavage/methylation domain-containing protein